MAQGQKKQTVSLKLIFPLLSRFQIAMYVFKGNAATGIESLVTWSFSRLLRAVILRQS